MSAKFTVHNCFSIKKLESDDKKRGKKHSYIHKVMSDHVLLAQLYAVARFLIDIKYHGESLCSIKKISAESTNLDMAKGSAIYEFALAGTVHNYLIGKSKPLYQLVCSGHNYVTKDDIAIMKKVVKTSSFEMCLRNRHSLCNEYALRIEHVMSGDSFCESDPRITMGEVDRLIRKSKFWHDELHGIALG